MNLTPHFTLEEFQITNHRQFDNELPIDLVDNAKRTLNMLERIRTALHDHPILISSGYRSLPVNRAVGSSDTSDHVQAYAVDFTSPMSGSPKDICEALLPRVDELAIGQLIHEFGRWVHVSSKIVKNPVNRVITIDKFGTRVGILDAR